MLTSENVKASSGGGPRTRNQPTSGSRCKQIVRIVDGVERRAIDLDAGRVEDERVLLFARGAAQSRTDHVVVVPAGGVQHVDELRQDVLLRADLLHGHDVELADDLDQQRRDARLGDLLSPNT